MFRSAECNLFRAPLRGGGAPGPQNRITIKDERNLKSAGLFFQVSESFSASRQKI